MRRALERVALRWRQLPLDRAGRHAAVVRQFAARCAGLDAAQIPDLGPATAADQLAVAVFDACSAGPSQHLAGRLTDLLARLG